MSTKSWILSAAGLSLLVSGIQLPASAQTTIDTTDAIAAEDISAVVDTAETDEIFSLEGAVSEDEILLESDAAISPSALLSELAIEPTSANIAVEQAVNEPAENITSADAVETEDQVVVISSMDAADLMAPAEPAATAPAEFITPVESTELAQVRRRRRTQGRLGADNYIGVGADFGFADDVSLAVISKFAITDQLDFRPSVLIGDDFSILAPVTFDFNRFSTDAAGFQINPYAGVGASYQDEDDGDSDLGLLLSAGVDVPVSSSFTLNAQANWSVFNESDFGVTVGVGYNFGNLFR